MNIQRPASKPIYNGRPRKLCIASIVLAIITTATTTSATTRITTSPDGTLLLKNDKISIRFCPALGDHPQHIVAGQVTEPRPFNGSVNSGPLFENQVAIDGKPMPKTAARIVERSSADDHITVVFRSNNGPLEITRRYTMHDTQAAYDDLSEFRNTSTAPVELQLAARGDVAGRNRPEPDFQRWAWPVMRWYLPDNGRFITHPVFHLQKELQNNDKPLSKKIRQDSEPFTFGYVNGRALGFLIGLEIDIPIEFQIQYDRFRGSKDGKPVRLNEIDTQWSWRVEKPLVLKPGNSVIIRRRVMLLDGQGGVDAIDPKGLVAYLDVPPYRDTDERIEVAAQLNSDRRRTVKVSLLLDGGKDKPAVVHEPQTMELPAGRSREIVFDVAHAIAPRSHLALVVEQPDGKPLCVTKTVSVGTSTDEGRGLAKEYHRRYPLAADFQGTLEELGRALINPKKRLRVADGFPPDVQLRWYNTAAGAADRLRNTYDLSHAATKRRSDDILKTYRKWFPRYTKVLKGQAQALGVPPALLALDEQARFDKIEIAQKGVPNRFKDADLGCLDIAFPAPKGVWLTWNKDRDAVDKGVAIEYERCRISDGLSFHGIANYGVNEAGLGVAGAALNANASLIARGQAGVEASCDARRLFGPPDPMMLLLLECRTVDDAIRLITNPDAPLTWWANCMIADRNGRVIVWQSAGTECLIRAPHGDWPYFTSTNYPHDWPINDPDQPTSGGRSTLTAFYRESNLARIMRGFPRILTLDDVTHVLRNRSEPGAIEQDHFNSPKASLTVMSYVIDTNTSDIHIAYSPPSRHKYIRYELVQKEYRKENR
ncbi:MAG: hypothetical protein JXM70_11390 [Pirellulales bacterium]|nr:hypothetical protein [Pirellulales bacterium]